MTKNYTNANFISIHEWEIGSIFSTNCGRVFRLTKWHGHHYTCVEIVNLVDGEDYRIWNDGRLMKVTGSNSYITMVVLGTKLETPRCAISYASHEPGSVLMLSNNDIAVITKQKTRDSKKVVSIQCVSNVEDADTITQPNFTGLVELSEYGFGYVNNTPVFVLAVLYRVSSKELQSYKIERPFTVQ